MRAHATFCNRKTAERLPANHARAASVRGTLSDTRRRALAAPAFPWRAAGSVGAQPPAVSDHTRTLRSFAVALDADVIVIGAGLAGLVAACELVAAKRRVIVLDQEPEQALGGQAFWSFGGLLLIDSPEQRRMGIRDSRDLAWSDWQGSAAFDRPEDHWPRQWAEAYVNFAAGEKRPWLRERGGRRWLWLFRLACRWHRRGFERRPRRLLQSCHDS